MIPMVHGRWIAISALACAAAAVIISLHRQSKSDTSNYSVSDLLLGDDNKASPSRHVLFGSFFLTSWVVVYATMTEKLTDTMFTAYLAAWVIPAVTKLIVGQQKGAGQ